MNNKIYLPFIITAILLVLINTSGFGQTVNIRELSHTLVTGEYKSVAFKDNYMFTATLYGIKIYDIDDPSAPLETCYIPSEGLTQNVIIDADFLFVCDALAGLVIFNVANPENPIYLDDLNTPGNTWDVVTYQNYAYTATEDYGIQIIDFSDPYDLELVDIVYIGGEVNNIDIQDNWLYVSMGIAGLGVYDIQNPEDPQFMINWNTVGGKCKDIHIFENEDVLAMADHSNGVHLLDLSFPWIPTWINSISSAGMIAVSASGAEDSGILSYFNEGIRSFDLTGSVLDSLEIEDCSNVAVNDGFCYVCRDISGFEVVNFQSPQNLFIQASLPDSGVSFKATAKDDILYVGRRYGGLSVVDAGDPWNPVFIDNLNTGGETTDIIFSPDSNYLYAADFGAGINVFDLGDPLHPQLINTVPVSPDTGAHTFEYNEGYLYMTSFYDGLHVYDVSDPTTPDLVNTVEAPGSYREIAFSEDGNYLYACAEYYGLYVYIVNSPEDIEIADTLTFFHRPYDIAIKGDFAYVADWENGMYAIDISNYAYIFKVDSISALSAVSGVSIINDDYLAMCDWTEGFAVVDISDPTDLNIAQRFDTPGYAWNSYYDGEILLVADNYDLGIYDLFDNVHVQPPTESYKAENYAVLHPSYPNPFNSSTQLKFVLKEGSRIEINIFNNSGEIVEQVNNQYYTPGTHIIRYSPVSVASGIYYVQLKTEKSNSIQKITYIK